MAALAVNEFGTDEQRQALLPGVADGSRVLTVALTETGTGPLAPMTSADGGTLSGTKLLVPFGAQATHAVVPARSGEDVGLYLVDLSGVRRHPGGAGRHLGPARHPPRPGGRRRRRRSGSERRPTTWPWLVERATAALCATAIGICEEALRLTAEYTKTREQFDRPIATFQAVGQRAADAYIDTEAVRLTAWQAAWRLSEGLPSTEQVAIAKFWCAEGGQRVVHSAQHLHGGMGVDRDYPLHRYFLWAKELELTLGGATALPPGPRPDPRRRTRLAVRAGENRGKHGGPGPRAEGRRCRSPVSPPSVAESPDPAEPSASGTGFRRYGNGIRCQNADSLLPVAFRRP